MQTPTTSQKNVYVEKQARQIHHPHWKEAFKISEIPPQKHNK